MLERKARLREAAAAAARLHGTGCGGEHSDARRVAYTGPYTGTRGAAWGWAGARRSRGASLHAHACTLEPHAWWDGCCSIHPRSRGGWGPCTTANVLPAGAIAILYTRRTRWLKYTACAISSTRNLIHMQSKPNTMHGAGACMCPNHMAISSLRSRRSWTRAHVQARGAANPQQTQVAHRPDARGHVWLDRRSCACEGPCLGSSRAARSGWRNRQVSHLERPCGYAQRYQLRPFLSHCRNAGQVGTKGHTG